MAKRWTDNNGKALKQAQEVLSRHETVESALAEIREVTGHRTDTTGLRKLFATHGLNNPRDYLAKRAKPEPDRAHVDVPAKRYPSVLDGVKFDPGSKHLVIPDTQVKPGVPLDHFYWIAEYAAEKQPDVIIHLGDHFDMPSLSSYDKGKASAEGTRINTDLEAGFRARDILDARWAKVKGWNPRKVAIGGNHENRLLRHVDSNPELVGTFDWQTFGWEKSGWELHTFLSPVDINGVSYCHFFPANSNGQVMQTKNGAPNAKAQVIRQAKSCTAGHQQGLDTHIHQTPDGPIRGVICGSAYLHSENYMGPADLQRYWRGVLLKHNVRNGDYNLCEVSLDWLGHRYGKLTKK